MNTFLLILLNCTWGIVQNIVGGTIFLCNLCVGRKATGDTANAGGVANVGDPENAAGPRRHFPYKGTRVSTWKKHAGLSMGLFIFVPVMRENVDAPIGYSAQKYPDSQRVCAIDENLLRHEYGHSIQSAILGPLYIPLVGIPSILWCNVKPFGRKWRSGRMSYYDAFQEKWADKLGGVFRGSKADVTGSNADVTEKQR